MVTRIFFAIGKQKTSICWERFRDSGRDNRAKLNGNEGNLGNKMGEIENGLLYCQVRPYDLTPWQLAQPDLWNLPSVHQAVLLSLIDPGQNCIDIPQGISVVISQLGFKYHGERKEQ